MWDSLYIKKYGKMWDRVVLVKKSVCWRISVCWQFHVEMKCDMTEIDREIERDRETDAQIDYHKGFRALGGNPPKGLEVRALWLWYGLSHSALLCSIEIVLKVSLRFAAFNNNAFEGCSCKNKLAGKNMEYEFKNSSSARSKEWVQNSTSLIS